MGQRAVWLIYIGELSDIRNESIHLGEGVYMSFDFSSSIDKMTGLYLDNAGLTGKKGTSLNKDDIAAFGKEFSEVYDSMQAMRTLDETMRWSYDMNHKDDKKRDIGDPHSALTFSRGSNRIMDMLTQQISEEMDDKVSKAMSNGLKSMNNKNKQE